MSNVRNLSKGEIYDRLYMLAAKVLDKHQPCKACGRCEYFGGTTPGCCEGCPFLSSTGCTIQSLGCKLWLCHAERGWKGWPLKPIVRHQLSRLERIAHRHDINFARATKDEVMAFDPADAEAKGYVGRMRKWYFYYTIEGREAP